MSPVCVGEMGAIRQNGTFTNKSRLQPEVLCFPDYNLDLRVLQSI